MGGAVSSITGGDFKSGAIAAGASQAMAGALNSTFNDQPNLRQAFSQIVGLTAAGLAGADINKASWVALMAEEYNRQLHQKEVLVLEKLQEENPEKAYQLKAAACAIVHCSASVHPDDQKNYDVLTKLEADGSGSRMLKARCSLPELLTSIRNGIRSTTTCCAMKKGGKWGQTTFKKYSENVICPIFIPWNGSAGDAGNPLLASYIPAAVQKALGVRLK